MRHNRVVDYEHRIIVKLAFGYDYRHALVADIAKAVRKALRLDYAFDTVLDCEALKNLLHILLRFGNIRFIGVSKVKNLLCFVEDLVLSALAFCPLGGKVALLFL